MFSSTARTPQESNSSIIDKKWRDRLSQRLVGISIKNDRRQISRLIFQRGASLTTSNKRVEARILVVDNRAIIQMGIATVLSDTYSIVQAKTAIQALAVMAECNCELDAIILSYSLQDMNAIQLARTILGTCPLARIILYSGLEDEHVIGAAIRAGVRAVVCKFESPRLLLRALDAVLKGETHLSPAASRCVMRLLVSAVDVPDTLLHPLSPAENTVLLLFARGKSNKQIAYELEKSVHTIGTIRERIYNKLKVHSTAEAIAAATRFRLLPPAAG